MCISQQTQVYTHEVGWMCYLRTTDCEPPRSSLPRTAEKDFFLVLIFTVTGGLFFAFGVLSLAVYVKQLRDAHRSANRVAWGEDRETVVTLE